MSFYKLIVIGSSAGGIEALIKLVNILPKDFTTPICIAQHISPAKTSSLPIILTRQGKLPASHPHSRQQLIPGHIFLAPPGSHLSIAGAHVVVTHDQHQRYCPSIDLLFDSAARSYGTELIGVILTGMLTDGTIGLRAVKRNGGRTIIQDPQEALYPSMPQSAKDHCVIDDCLPLGRIGLLLQRLTNSSD